MMRVAVAVVLLLGRQESGEDLFKKLEKNLSEAKSLSLKFKGEMSAEGEKAKITGSLRLKSGDRYVFQMTLARTSEEWTMEARSDGKRVVTLTDGKRSEEPVKEGIGRFLTAVITRTGFMVSFISLSEAGREATLPKPDDFLKASGFELGTADRTLRRLKFRVAVKSLSESKVELWLDETKLVPAKILTDVKQGKTELHVVENYEDVSTEEIPDAEFEHKK